MMYLQIPVFLRSCVVLFSTSWLLRGELVCWVVDAVMIVVLVVLVVVAEVVKMVEVETVVLV